MFSENPMQALLYVLVSFLAMCVAISFHEWAHAFASYKPVSYTHLDRMKENIELFDFSLSAKDMELSLIHILSD